MPISPDRLDRFTFLPGQLTELTDPDEITAIHRKIGFIPPTAEEQAYIAEQWAKRWDKEPGLSTDSLRTEYAQLKTQGRI